MLSGNCITMSEYLHFFYNHIELSIALVVILLLILWEELGSKRYTKTGIPPQTLVDLMNHSGAAVLDIRTPDIFKEGHISDAINIPADTIESHLKKLVKYKNNPVVIVADKEREAARILALLKDKGFQNPLILSGGLTGWKQADLPLTTTSKRSH